MKVACAVVLLCLFSAVFAHDWMETPTPHNGGTAQQVSPCDPITPSSVVNNLVVGQPLDVSWANGHETGTHYLSIAPFGKDTTVDDFTTVASVAASTTQQPQHYSLPADTFKAFSLGSKITLRYSWSGWDNCATIQMAAAAPAGAVAPPATVKTNPVTNQPIAAGDLLLMNSANQTIGTFNIYNGALVCASGYHADGNRCVAGAAASPSSGLSGAAQFFIAFFVIAIVGVAAVAGYSYYKHGDALHYVRRNKKSDSYVGYQDHRSGYVAPAV